MMRGLQALRGRRPNRLWEVIGMRQTHVCSLIELANGAPFYALICVEGVACRDEVFNKLFPRELKHVTGSTIEGVGSLAVGLEGRPRVRIWRIENAITLASVAVVTWYNVKDTIYNFV